MTNNYPPLFIIYVERTIKHEIGSSVDGWVHGKGDLGGVTMWGISSVAFPKYKSLIEKRKLTRVMAIEIYYQNFFLKIPMIEKMDPRLGFYLFDTKVHGSRKPLEIIQEFLNLTFGCKLAVDGLIGPKTTAMLLNLKVEEIDKMFNHIRPSLPRMAKEMADRVMDIASQKGLEPVNYRRGFLARLQYRLKTSERITDV